MLTEVGADAVMIGRAALGNPWLLQQVETYLRTGELIPEPTPREKIQTAKLQLHRLVELKGEHLPCGNSALKRRTTSRVSRGRLGPKMRSTRSTRNKQ